MSDQLQKRLDAACEAIRKRDAGTPQVGLVLGSGLGAFADSLENRVAVPYDQIPHMPTTTVSGHAGQLCLGKVHGVSVACLQGRAHMYEGHDPSDVVFGVRLLARLGCFAVLLSNAAGGIRKSFRPGTLMAISDHLNLTGRSPLLGPNDPELGPRFPDMTRAYDPRLSKFVRDTAADLEIPLEEGVYAALLGPTYETPAEIRMLRGLGADAVGMSTVPEVIALRHMSVRCAAISCITNMAAGMTANMLDHSEVEKTAGQVRDSFVKLLAGCIKRIGEADWDSTTGRQPTKK